MRKISVADAKRNTRVGKIRQNERIKRNIEQAKFNRRLDILDFWYPLYPP